MEIIECDRASVWDRGAWCVSFSNDYPCLFQLTCSWSGPFLQEYQDHQVRLPSACGAKDDLPLSRQTPAVSGAQSYELWTVMSPSTHCNEEKRLHDKVEVELYIWETGSIATHARASQSRDQRYTTRTISYREAAAWKILWSAQNIATACEL